MSVDPREKQAYMEASPAQREVVRRLLCNVLGILRAQYFSYQTSHWQACGDSYYGNHLLFQRLYESVEDQIDLLAEKLVGYLGASAVNMKPQLLVVANYGAQWAQVDCPHIRGIQSEKDCQSAIKAAYEGIKAADAMTLGLDDFLMATANSHETNAYLLQQVLSHPPSRTASLIETWRKMIAVEAVAPSAESYFRPNPRKEEVDQFADSGAISNIPSIAGGAASEMGLSRDQEVADAKAAPPTPTEIDQMPGADEVSTLNRYVVDAVEANRPRLATWLAEIEADL